LRFHKNRVKAAVIAGTTGNPLYRSAVSLNSLGSIWYFLRRL
jgi:hypothetical protein